MTTFLERDPTTRETSVAVITQTTVGIILVSVLFANVFIKNGIIDNWTPYILVYLCYLIIISPIITKIKKPVTATAITSERKKYVTAHDELVKAMKCAQNNPEDVMMHVRSAIDLSIQERFGFKKIHPMMKFLEMANELNLPLPSYDLIYQYFDTGSSRLHSGTVNTPFEVSQITRTVSDFMNELDKTQITQKQIEEFKRQCKFVE